MGAYQYGCVRPKEAWLCANLIFSVGVEDSVLKRVGDAVV